MEDKLKKLIKMFDNEEWISIESLQEISHEELIEILHG